MKQPRNTYGGFISAISEWGMTFRPVGILSEAIKENMRKRH
jgi:hypothetical protein